MNEIKRCHLLSEDHRQNGRPDELIKQTHDLENGTTHMDDWLSQRCGAMTTPAPPTVLGPGVGARESLCGPWPHELLIESRMQTNGSWEARRDANQWIRRGQEGLVSWFVLKPHYSPSCIQEYCHTGMDMSSSNKMSTPNIFFGERKNKMK